MCFISCYLSGIISWHFSFNLCICIRFQCHFLLFVSFFVSYVCEICDVEYQPCFDRRDNRTNNDIFFNLYGTVIVPIPYRWLIIAIDDIKFNIDVGM